MFKSFYIKKNNIQQTNSKYLQSIDAIFADTKIIEHDELKEDITSSTIIIQNKKKWWKCC